MGKAPKRVSSKDVAQKAGVSRSTVTFVLNNVRGIQIREETLQRVIQAAKEVGYVPNSLAQALASQRSHNVGLVLSRTYQHIASDAFLMQVMEGLSEVTNQH